MDDTARTERLAQRDVNTAIRTKRDGDVDTDGNISSSVVRNRCNFDFQLNDGTYLLRKWRGSFTLRYVGVTTPTTMTPAQKGGVANGDRDHWCDAVPTNNLTNNPANFAGPIRTNFIDTVCVTWPDGAGTPYASVKAKTNGSCP